MTLPPKFPPAIEPGRDAEAIEFTPEGELIVTWTDGMKTSTPPNDDLAVEIRAKGFATHKFLQSKFRKYPVRRI